MEKGKFGLSVVFFLLMVNVMTSTVTGAEYDATTGVLHMPQVTVAGDAFGTVYSVEMLQRSGTWSFDLVNVSTQPSPPERFTTEWLQGKTLYQVWFGQGDTSNDQPVVVRLAFRNDGTVVMNGLVNSSPGDQVAAYTVDSAGRLIVGNDNADGNEIVCGSTQNYIKTYYYTAQGFDNVDLYFFQQEDAMLAAGLLGGMIPGCSTAP